MVLVGGEGGGIGGEPVAQDLGALLDTPLHLSLDGGGGYVLHHPHGRMGGPPAPDARRHQNRAPALRPPAPLAGPLGPEVGVVQLQQPAQQVAAVSLAHGGANLVGAGPGGLVGDARHPGKGEDGEAGFLAGQKEDEPEPDPQGGLGLLHHRARGEGTLVATAPALVEVAGGEEGVLSAPAVGQENPSGHLGEKRKDRQASSSGKRSVNGRSPAIF